MQINGYLFNLEIVKRDSDSGMPSRGAAAVPIAVKREIMVIGAIFVFDEPGRNLLQAPRCPAREGPGAFRARLSAGGQCDDILSVCCFEHILYAVNGLPGREPSIEHSNFLEACDLESLACLDSADEV